jgi:enolase
MRWQKLKIQKIKAREIFDSRGNPTVEVDLIVDGHLVRAAVPSGASTGIHEALELRDSDNKDRLLGKGVLKAVKNVNEKIAPKLIGLNPSDLRTIDKIMFELDGSGPAKKNLGANAILAVSMAVCRAGAIDKSVPLYKHIADLSNKREFIFPVPSFNVINGGEHGGNNLDIQEFMILPVGATTFTEALVTGAEVYQNLKNIIKDKYGRPAINVGDEGGFAPNLSKTTEAIDLIMSAIKKAGHEDDVKIGFDAAASEYYNEDKNLYSFEGKEISSGELLDRYLEIINTYPVVSFEDPFDQDDFSAFTNMTQKIGNKVQIVGDDLLVTNVERIKKAIKEKSANALLLKVNQIGSVSESIDAAKLSKNNNWGVMVSHRSGETEDSFIADLVVGLSAGEIKTGAPCRSERLAKYNQLLRIEEEMVEKEIAHRYAGPNFRTV